MFNKKKQRHSSTFSTSSSSPMRGYTVLFIPNETGATKRFNIPKTAFVVLMTLVFGVVGAVTAITFDYVNLRAAVSDYERLKTENLSIRSEAAALAAKLSEVQSTLNKVDSFSDQVRAVVQIDGKKNSIPSASPIPSVDLPDGIGPLTKEEVALSKAPSPNPSGAIKFDNLEFKDLFVRLSDIKSKSGNQAQELELLLGDLREYRKQIDATPTISPVKGWVTSLFGVRNSPIFRQNRMHWGVDIAAPLGSPIRSAGTGTVIRVGNAEDYGIFCEVSHGYGLVTRYAHAQHINVRVGDKVKKGTVLGAVGMTGRTTGPHLHYEIEVNGKKVNPATYMQAGL